MTKTKEQKPDWTNLGHNSTSSSSSLHISKNSTSWN